MAHNKHLWLRKRVFPTVSYHFPTISYRPFGDRQPRDDDKSSQTLATGNAVVATRAAKLLGSLTLATGGDKSSQTFGQLNFGDRWRQEQPNFWAAKLLATGGDKSSQTLATGNAVVTVGLGDSI
jgi:hypothetical protein